MISGEVSSLMAATTTCSPCDLAASSTRNGNLPLPAISPTHFEAVSAIGSQYHGSDFTSRLKTSADLHELAQLNFPCRQCSAILTWIASHGWSTSREQKSHLNSPRHNLAARY